MKHWLFAAGAAALMAGIALPAIADETPVCTWEQAPSSDPKLTEQDKDALARAEKDAANGVISGMRYLARIKEQGLFGVPVDRAGALDLYERTASAGEFSEPWRMCVAYLLGEGRPKNAAKGMDYCNMLDDKDPVGLFARGYDYQMGLSGPADEKVAEQFYLEAFKAGSGDAAVALAGINIKAGKLDVAREWFRHGVFLGSADAMDGLAAMTEAGQGGPANAAEAGWLYWHAARRGNVHAAEQFSGQVSGQLAGRTVAVKRTCPRIGSDLVMTTQAGTRFIDRTAASKNGTTFTHTYLSKSGPKSETLSYDGMIASLMAVFSSTNYYARQGGLVSFECYIDANHMFDACIVPRDYPGFGFERAVMGLFDSNITISDTDALGNPTAGRVWQQTLRWPLAGGRLSAAGKGYGTTVRSQ